MTGTASAAGFTDNGQHNVFGGNAWRRFAQHFNLHGLRAALFQGLRGKHVLNFGSTDTECQRTERAVRGGVGITADDGHARQRHTLLWPNDVHDALERVIQVIQLNAELSTVFHQLLHLNTRHLARRIDVFGLRRNVVIHGGEGFRRLTHFAPVRTQTIKGLRRRHFMDQMAINIE